jgi:hypothetical protein
MEYLQFGFAAVFCVVLYADQRTIIKAFTRSNDRLAHSIAEVMQYVRQSKDNPQDACPTDSKE